jgi:tRNA threonylcarbamoyladenosine biosynthesis protein TsaB
MPGPLTLVLETSTPAASLALFGPDGLLGLRRFSSDRNHNALIFSPLSELMTLREGAEIGLVLVGSGPGSYSGTRVGIAAAQGVAIAAGCPCVALPSLLATAPAENGAHCLAIGDARRGNFWTASLGGGLLVAEPAIVDAHTLAQRVDEALQGTAAVFSFEETSRFPLPAEQSARVTVESPDAIRLHEAWQTAAESSRRSWAAAPPQPIYLQPPHITPAKRPWLIQPQA